MEVRFKDFQNTKNAVDKPQNSLANFLNRDIKLFPDRLSDKTKEAFYIQLYTLLGAGLDIKTTLELIEGEQTKAFNRGVLRAIKEHLILGASLSEAMEKSKQFTPYEFFSIQIGEETGKLNVVVEQLHQYFNTRLKQRRQLTSALSYPAVVLLTSIGAVSFMLLWIVPMFNDVFKRFGGDLPFITKVIISFSSFLSSYFYIFLLVFISVVSFIYVNRNSVKMKRVTAKMLLGIPFIGKIVYSLHLARFCSSMSLLLASKVPLLRSLDLISQMVTFYPIQTTIKKISDDIMYGETFYNSLSKFDVYDKRMLSLLKVGEEVNKLDLFFAKLASQYTSEVDHKTSLLNTFLEPIMIIFLGLVVGFILMAMYLPMFQLSTNIGG